jgi:hypothetical protein
MMYPHRDHVFSLRLTDVELARLSAAAAEEMITTSQLVRRAALRSIAENKRAPLREMRKRPR